MAPSGVAASVVVPSIVGAHAAASGARWAPAVVRTAVGRAAVGPRHSAIAAKNRGAREVIIAAAVIIENREIPCRAYPTDGAVEVIECHIKVVLPTVQNVAHVGVAILPVIPVNVVHGVDAEQIVQVNLISTVVLVGRKVELIGHLVGKEQSFLAGSFVTQGIRRNKSPNKCQSE